MVRPRTSGFRQNRPNVRNGVRGRIETAGRFARNRPLGPEQDAASEIGMLFRSRAFTPRQRSNLAGQNPVSLWWQRVVEEGLRLRSPCQGSVFGLRFSLRTPGPFQAGGDEGLVGLLPSPPGRGAGGEGPKSEESPCRRAGTVLPSPQTSLPEGEGLHASSACSGPDRVDRGGSDCLTHEERGP